MAKQTFTIQNQKGQTLIEYLIIVALVGIGTIGLMRVVSQGINLRFANVVEALGGTAQSKPTLTVSSGMLKKKDLQNFSSRVKNGKQSGSESDNNEE